MEPLTRADERLLKTVSSLEEEGFRPIAGWEVDAGLADDEVIPGSYTVSLDLSFQSDRMCVSEKILTRIVEAIATYKPIPFQNDRAGISSFRDSSGRNGFLPKCFDSVLIDLLHWGGRDCSLPLNTLSNYIP